MARTLRPTDFVPRGFYVESVADDGAMIVVTVHPTSERDGSMPGLRHGHDARP